MVFHYIYKICAINKWDQPVPVIFIVFFKIKIAIIKKKSNPSHLNTNQKPFANNACIGFSWFPIKSHLMIIACVL